LTVQRDADPLRAWDPATGRLKWSATGEFDPITWLDCGSDGLVVTNGGKSHSRLGYAVRFWNLADGRMLAEYLAPNREEVATPMFDPKGQRVAWGEARAVMIHRIERK
jgi:hypothetical protein